MAIFETYEMTITFTPPLPGKLPKFTADVDPLEVPPGVHQIALYLATDGAGAATFAPRAIDWCDASGHLIVSPQAFSMTTSPLQLTLTDRNYPGCHGEFKFVLYVTYEGVTYASPDPTIINKQPGGAITIGFEQVPAAVRVA